ncbi:A-kinase anchor protein 9 isoform 2 [Homo sapiens]|uniref:A-kinase anchor protein 9 n=1 Tax=Homo sapiens TaxID=9606 RepID=AKAP9_HUMAN|nr:A-kinase anchor protein 9 isoform 2 [Homo sapiens]Q99996.4 RecName: Full=A-kinase anchor protein 9; Short=AKAP-9; AltName: Full=A-kinase anchor protein 350 kDa; Short=AKAP 350; Short=hgAKAP 350; AltName: Full=A-kinase anchor protein 450 kDa; Short=AKAP 450; AltName: Full=AKAP 120-like protein; AltName: Full=Centrosome- and Golgi-localized PKN-associated protein; Short=CG-NAP; AltName: Full=Protein hyperion; AltName: Full=Protein kinase A-anchoring protein 9; Short=PRKA9; AltName: Full=Protein y|eukprot:NP_005742.4 A-kinase anchor protein 9 isoform 2 [Homo sapiens]
MEDEERQKKLEAGKAKLAQFRQRKAQSDGQSPSKKQKKKRKTSSSKHDVSAHHDLNIDQSQCNEMYINSSQRVESTVIPESTIMRTLHSGEITSHEQGFSVELESEISTTADDCSSEVNGCSFVMRTGKPTNLLREEEFGVDDSYSEQGAQDSPTHLEMMESELAGKQHEIEELNRELEEMRVTYGTEGLQQLQEFEAAIKQRDGIITQLTANLQQARREKDETMREFLELTEQSQKLQIQFQQLQASETLRNSTHSSTAADLLQAKQQILTHQQQLEEQDHLLEDYQKKKEDFTMQISFLQEKIKVYEMEQDKKVENSNKEEIQEKETIIEELNTKIIEEEKKTLELKDKLTTADKLLGELQEQIVQKNQEIKNMKLELTNSKQKERQSSEEIKQLMGTVEELQKRNHKDSQFETDIVQRMEQETQRKLEQLRAELDEMYGQQIVQMKQELIRQHMAQMEEMKTRHKGEMENALRSYSNITVNEDQIKLMNVAINELNIKLQDTNSQKEKLKEELGLILEEKCALQRQLEDLVEELSFSREQIQRARQTIAEQESKLNEAHKSLSTVEDLKAEIVSASESRKELELKHEAEVTNYKIKLEMLEKEKNAVLDRMAESQEAELERLRTQLLFSHEEELSKLKEDLEIEHRINIEKLKDNLGIHYKQQIDGLQNEMSQKIETMQFEKDNLITKQNQLILEISKLKDLQQSLVNSKSEEMTLQINELQKEIEILRQEEKEKGTLEQEVQELQLKTELLEKQMKEKENDLQEKFAQLEAENSILKDEKKTLEDMLKIHTPVSQEERLIFLDSIKSKSKDSVWEKEIEILIEENEDLKQQCIQLNEEIEKQRNTFSFAEKNFEVNYQELQEEYACLLKVKDDLEDSKNKQELEYKSKLKALNEELHLQRINPTTVKMKSSVFDEDKTFVAETLEMGEVVEKDTTELMEKLEVTKREKLELSQRLSDLSEQLKQKHGEISFLNEEVKSLKQEKEQVSLRCRELEIIINHNRAENVQSCDTQVSSLLDGVVTMTSRGAEGSVSKVNKSFGEESKIMVEDKVSFENMTVGEESKQEQLILDHLPSVTKESSLRATQPSENDKLQKELNVLKSEQNDLRLQMEAQRICLSLVYSTHVDQVREYMENEKDKALCSLKEELIFAQEEKIKELQKIHQLELQTMKTQETGDEGKPLHLLIGKLQKAVSEECSYFLQTLCSVLGEYYTPALKCEVNAEDKENSGDYISENEDPELQDYRYEVQDFQENMHTLLNKVTEEYNKLLVLQTRLSKIWGQQTDGMKLEFGEENLPKEETEFLSIHSQMTNLEDIDVNHKSKLSSLQDLEKTKLEEQVQELESLISSLQQQLKETEQNYEAEIHCLQKRLQAVSESTVPPSLPVDSVVITESDAQRTMYPGSCVKKNIDGTIEFSGEFGVKEETNIVKLLEKQYQEQLEEEVAKVIVSMSIAFAQQTELSRISGGKENTASSKQAHAVCQQEQHYFNEMKLSQDQIGFQTFETVDVKFKEEFKPLSKELGEHGKEILLSNSDPHDIPESKDCVLTISEEMFSKDKTFIVRQSIHDEISVSSMDASRQLMLNEEQLEDMRQELVRQYQEHQQATELLRQAHMRQMERQREDQEQLQEEIKRLNRQLAQRSSIDNENLVSERERVLLEELEALKQLSLAGREKLCCELRNSSTQTQNGNENQGEVEEQTFKEKELDRKPEDVPPEILSNERYALQKANNRLLKILLEVVKTTAAVEETIGRHVLGILDRSSKSQSSASLIWRSEAEASVKSCVHEEHTRVTDESIPSYSGSDMPRNDINMWSKVTEEGTELSQRLVRSGFAGTEIDPENEELMLNISSRLQAAVEKLLEAISETSSQLEHAKVTQTELMRESFRQKQEATESLKCQEELRERLHEESRAREQLAVELSKAEGVIDGYADEKTLFERQIQEKTDIIDRLEQELLCASNRLQELEAEQQQIQEERELLSRQKEAMKAEAGPVEQQLLQETEKLMKEKLEVQCQAEKVRDDLQKQVKALEIDVEEQVSRFIELEQEKNTELMDLRQQNQALEKQLEKMRKFLDEQAIDREHERDVFQQEIQKLEQQLKVVPRFQPISEHQTREVEQLANHLKEKTDKCSELLLSKEQLQRDIQERNEEIEKLEFRVRELEQALLVSADTFQKVEDRKHFGAVEAKPELSLEVQLQAERDAIDRKEKEITNLEEQLEQFREELENKNEEVQQLHMQLEIQKKESTTRLQELEQENKLFKDDMEKLGLAIKESDAMSTQDQHVLFGKFAQIIQEKEVEIDQLNEQVTKLQQQLKITTDNKVIEEKNELIRDLETQIECLMSDQECVKRNREEEIEQLNEVIEKLQQELANIGQKTSMNAHSLSEEADSLKHQLDVVIAEKLALEQQVETANEEMTFMKNVLKETNFKMNQLTQELFSLKRERESVEKIQSIPENSVNVAIDHLSKDKPELEVVLTEDALKSLENQTYFKSFEENGKGSIINLETRLLQLESTVSAKDLELTQCYKQIKDMQEQGQFETEMLQKKIVNLQKIVEEKVAAALVSQIQLEAVQEYAKFCQDNQTISSEPERTNIQNLNQLREDELGSDISALTLRISELESQVVEMHTSLILEKEQVEIAEKNVLEKEKKLLELQKLLEGNEKKQREKEKKRSPQDVEVLKTTTELFHSNEESGFFNELEALRAESVATKAELASYKEKAEKLQEELLVKETNMTSLQKDLSQVRDHLAEAKEKLSILEKEDETEVQESKKACMFEPLPIKLSKSIASQTDGTLKISSSNQTPQILVKNAGIQINLQSECSSEEVTEIISQFTEKIEKMQELHAAEILDMESRHISETETLKREHYVAVQLLKEECGTLKAVIQCLRSKEGSSIPELAHSDAYQTREICSSDSGSDWGQGIYLTHSQGFDIASEGRGEESESATDSFPKKIKGLLRAVHNEGMQVLSLTESPYSDGEDHSIQQVSEPWLEERKAYINTISSLKDLITKMQLQREAEVYDSSQSHESFSDWRGELLLALQQVFLEERSVLLAAFRTELTALGTTDAVGLLNCLEQRIQEQGVEYQAAMECLQKADRRSLLSEIQALHAQMNGRKITLKREQESEKPSQELLEYNIQQKQSQMLEMQVELSSMKDRATELQEQLSSEKMVVAELKSELAQTKLELETTLKAQHKHLKELEAFRLEVKDKTDEVHLLNDTLASEQKKSRELQWALEKEKAKLGRSEERDKEELEDLKFSLESQKQRNLQLNLLLEQQKQLLNESQQKIESQRMLYDAQLSEEQGRNLELQVLLESEKVRIREMSSTLDRERELHAQLQSSDGTGQSRPPLPSEDLLKELQKQLEEKHSRIVELLNETEKYKLDSLQTRQQMEKDRQVHRKTLQTEQEANTEGQKKMHELQSKVEDLQRQLEEKRQQVYKLDLEGQRLQGIMQEFQKQELEREEKRESRRILYQNLNEPTTWSLTSDRTRNWVLQQKIEGETKESNYAKLIEMNGGGTGCNHELEMIRQKLQCVASKLQVLPQKASERLQFETADDEDFIWVQENIDEIILQLQKLTGQQGEEPSLVSPSTSCGSLTERLLRQNAELTGHISQLTEEKNDLRNMVMKLEEQIRWYRQTGAGRDNSSRFSLNGGANIEAIIASEKEVWNREKLTLQKSLKRAEAEVYKLKAELRNDSLLQTLSPDSEHVTLKRIYGKYLRAESFRKALIYQKKYLLLLLGGFQECEDATLALLARMGGQPAFTDLEVITNRPKGFTRFRSAVRVSIAISRMKFLVRRWHRVTGSVSININRDGFGLNQGAEKTDSFYHSSGGLELYGEPRHTTYRSRSDLDYIRSPLPFQNRYPGTPADFNPGSLACSQLQNYDPDRALTDYITRLEALQRRLGTIQSGSTTQFHAGMRR